MDTPRQSPATADALRGWTVLVTRPEREAGGLAAQVRAAGGAPILQPGVEIHAVAEPGAREKLQRLRPGDVVVFTSGNAVRHALAVLSLDRWATGLPVLAVGEATGAVAAEAGFPAVQGPPVGTTGAMPLLPVIDALYPPPERAVLVAAPGGRTELVSALRERGIDASICHVYERRPATLRPNVEHAVERAGDRLIVIATSAAILATVTGLLPALSDRKVVVPSERVADAARDLGFREVAVAEAPDDRSLVSAAAAFAGADTGP